ncbi:RNA polymerase subunit sigma, partial [Streptomyces sp. NPDC059651]
MDHADDAVPIADLLEERRHLMDVAYWMLGSGGAAGAVVDEAYRRWYRLPRPERAQISDPRAWLAKVVGGICLDPRVFPDGRTASAAARADGEAGEDPDRTLEQEISAVLLRALDGLSPAERAAFVLNDVFGMAPGAVADIVGQ